MSQAKSSAATPRKAKPASFSPEDTSVGEDPFDFYTPPAKDGIPVTFRMDADQHQLMSNLLAARLFAGVHNTSDFARTAVFIFITRYLGGSEKMARKKLGKVVRDLVEQQELAASLLKTTMVKSVLEKYAQAMRNASDISAVEVAGKLWLQAEKAIGDRFRGEFRAWGLNALLTRPDIKGARDAAQLIKAGGGSASLGEMLTGDQEEDPD